MTRITRRRSEGWTAEKSNHHPTLLGAKDPLVASCNVTRVISGRFGSGGEKFENQKLASCYSVKTASGAVRDEEEFQRQGA